MSFLNRFMETQYKKRAELVGLHQFRTAEKIWKGALLHEVIHDVVNMIRIQERTRVQDEVQMVRIQVRILTPIQMVYVHDVCDDADNGPIRQNVLHDHTALHISNVLHDPNHLHVFNVLHNHIVLHVPLVFLVQVHAHHTPFLVQMVLLYKSMSFKHKRYDQRQQ
jgi:hypothetical protein